mmetsp:Transcript_56919/g.99507  ORF Transcript_56919/g.99507 Transcript_56919/m.99507 type:complete len:137 (-) Transcript_56919:155-565(-)
MLLLLLNLLERRFLGIPQPVLRTSDGLLQRRRVFLRQLLPCCPSEKRALQRAQVSRQRRSRIPPLKHLLIRLGVLLCFTDHVFDVFFRESPFLSIDRDGCICLGTLVLSGDMQNAIGIDPESDVDLWNTSRCRGYP